MIKKFSIRKLFGFRDIEILFDSEIKILIGENGLGKTTVLNSLYYVLKRMYSKLSKVDFESISLVFEDGEEINFHKNEMETYLDYQNNRAINRRIPLSIRKQLEEYNFDKIKNRISENFGDEERKIISNFIHENEIPKFAPFDLMVREIFKFTTEPKFDNFSKINTILNKYEFSILYLPTYRRVEEDLNNLGKFRRKTPSPFNDNELFYEEIEDDIEVTDDTLIHFGMEDVKERIKKITTEINKSTITGFSKLTGDMLSQLLKGFPDIEDKKIEKLDESAVKTIIHRVGTNISKSDRENILNLIDNKERLKEKKELVYFIYKLIDIYEKHKHLDNSVKKFCKICNEYLSGKKFLYNESSVDVAVYRDHTNDEIKIDKLSSGEKQIISIFSKLYLENSRNLLVLFDEPELSLSLPWQKTLLPDIINSNKCKFLLSVTHSPFIFDNELDQHAIGMNTYIK